MDFYPFIKNILFSFEPEVSHRLTLQSLQWFFRAHLLHFPLIENPYSVMGLQFKNRIGLAAGLDKNGEYIDALAALGFGFIEIGTVTPRAQPGNPAPRIFRLLKDEAIINRLGFNNKGMDYVAEQIARTRYRGVLGINIGKNRDTPNDKAVDDYLACFRKLAPLASYITLNISSPNTEGLRDLQQDAALTNLLSQLKTEQAKLATQEKYVPLVVKISPDLTDADMTSIAEVCLAQNVDGIIATNTTVSRNGLQQEDQFVREVGGLSGKPLFTRSTQVLAQLNALLQQKIPLIGVGGILDAEDARAKYAAGASLLQIYTGFIYRGPSLIREIAGMR